MITQERLKELFDYNPETGKFIRKVSKGNTAIGDEGGSENGEGYLQIMIDGRVYQAHRLVFLWETGLFPKSLVDHKDGNGSNNRRDNLRVASRSNNCLNSKRSASNTSGAKGVSFHKQTQKYRVQVTIKGKQQYFGGYDNLELADLVATEARNKYHGDFARHS